MTRSNTRITHRGGPLDGVKREVEGRPLWVECSTPDPVQLGRMIHGEASPDEPLRKVTHRYRRTDDWLRDGSLVYEYDADRF